MKKSLKKLNISKSTLSNLESQEILGGDRPSSILSIGHRCSVCNHCARVSNTYGRVCAC